MTSIFQTVLIQPIYNCFVFLIGVVPRGDIGLAIIILTLVIRAIFYPLFTSSLRTQMALQVARAELDEINEKFKDNKEEKARRTMEVFKRHRIKPLSLIVAPLLQLVVFISLSIVFYRLGLPAIRTDLLYPFVHSPAVVGVEFLGFLNIVKMHNIPLALVVGALQYAALYFTFARMGGAAGAARSPQQKSQAMQQKMMLYMLPVIVVVVSYTLPSAAGLYFAVTSVVTLGQEWFIRRRPL